MEVMAYSEEAIQLVAGVVVSVLAGNNDAGYSVNYAIANKVTLKCCGRSGRLCIRIIESSGVKPQFSVKFKA